MALTWLSDPNMPGTPRPGSNVVTTQIDKGTLSSLLVSGNLRGNNPMGVSNYQNRAFDISKIPENIREQLGVPRDATQFRFYGGGRKSRFFTADFFTPGAPAVQQRGYAQTILAGRRSLLGSVESAPQTGTPGGLKTLLGQ